MRQLPSLTLSLLFAAATLAPLPLLAADHAGHGDHHGAAPAQALSDGEVKKVDKTAGKVTISHGPLPNGMPAMTMAFPVKDAAWLKQLQPGQKIRFAVDDVAGVLTLVRVEAAK